MVQQYDESGNLARQATAVYGPEGELLTEKLHTSPTTDDTVASYSYDAAMRLVGLSDGNNHTTTYGYNPAGYLSAITYPGGDSLQFPQYDLAGRPTQRQDGNNVVTTYVYGDPDGLLSDIQYPSVGGHANPANVHLTYDSYDRRATMSDGTGSFAYGYDDADNVASVTSTYYSSSGPPSTLPARTISYNYYPNNSRAAMLTPGGNIGYFYDGDGRMSALGDIYGQQTHWSYFDNGTLAWQLLPNGTASFYTYSPRSFLTDLQTKTSGSTLLAEFGSPSPASQMLYDAVCLALY
jgi:YD repeat-containing protein